MFNAHGVHLVLWLRGALHRLSFLQDVSGTRLRARSRVREAWQAPANSKVYGAGPVSSHLIELISSSSSSPFLV